MELATLMEVVPSWSEDDNVQDLDALVAPGPSSDLPRQEYLNLTALATRACSSNGSVLPTDERKLQPQLAAAEDGSSKQQERAESRGQKQTIAGRRAQKRYRERQKARKKIVEVDYAATKAEVQSLRLRETQLEVRNTLLERVAALSKADVSIDITTHAEVPIDTELARKVNSGGPVLNVTLWDQHQKLDLRAIGKMSVLDFSQLWTVLTGTQHAMALVHAYPCMLNIDDLLDCLAAQHGAPSRQELLASAHTVDTAAHWQKLKVYIDNLGEEDYPVYVPFVKMQHA